jgi:serine/threonine-protein kinase RsbW
MPELAIQLTIDSCLQNVPLIGSAVSGLMQQLGGDELERYHVELCVVEAVTNSIRHAYGNLPGHPVSVHLKAQGKRLEIRVSNGGLGLPRARLENTGLVYDPSDIDNLPCGGMGLYLLRRIMDEVHGYEDGGTNHLVMVKRLATGAPRQTAATCAAAAV